MNIIYFTTAQENSDYKKYVELWKHPINSSNQIFHNKLIRSLSLNNHVDVISFRPFSKQGTNTKRLPTNERITSQIHWHYPHVTSSKFNRLRVFTFYAKRIVKSCPKDSIILVDTINPGALTIANFLAKTYKLPIIGICTDSPSNITNTTRAYAKLILKAASNLSGYICLTNGLNDLFNDKDKPTITIEGLVENDMPKKKDNPYGKYYFMGGALDEKYGVYNLIEAFKKLNNHTNLVLCGHHYDEKRIKEAIGDSKSIFFLNNIPNDEVLSLEASAYANINPRPYNEDLDRYSIPSKVLEYLNSGSPTISGKNTKLYKIFSSDIIWIKNNDIDSYVEALNNLDSLKEKDRKDLAIKAQHDANHYFSLEAIGSKLSGFLYLFTKR